MKECKLCLKNNNCEVVAKCVLNNKSLFEVKHAEDFLKGTKINTHSGYSCDRLHEEIINAMNNYSNYRVQVSLADEWHKPICPFCNNETLNKGVSYLCSSCGETFSESPSRHQESDKTCETCIYHETPKCTIDCENMRLHISK